MFIFVTSGCSILTPTPVEKLVYIRTPLVRPNRPILPTLNSDELECLSPNAKQKLYNRDLIRKHYAEDLESIIDSTHSD